MGLFNNLSPVRQYQEKILGSSVTSDGPVAGLAFNNLVIGQWYSIEGSLLVRTDNVDGNITVDIKNGTTLLHKATQNTPVGAGGVFSLSHPFKYEFEAASTDLDVEVSGASVNAFLQGTGAKNGTFARLSEIGNKTVTTDYT